MGQRRDGRGPAASMTGADTSLGHPRNARAQPIGLGAWPPTCPSAEAPDAPLAPAAEGVPISAPIRQAERLLGASVSPFGVGVGAQTPRLRSQAAKEGRTEGDAILCAKQTMKYGLASPAGAEEGASRYGTRASSGGRFRWASPRARALRPWLRGRAARARVPSLTSSSRLRRPVSGGRGGEGRRWGEGGGRGGRGLDPR